MRGMKGLEDVATVELVEELAKRKGVSKKIVDPYQDITVSINGPATVLVVID